MMMMNNNNCKPGFPPVPQRVTSEHLLIRPSERADATYLKKWWNDPAVTAPDGNMDGMQYDDSDMEDWFDRYVEGRDCATHFIICLRDPQESPIGEFYIASDDRPGSVGFAILIGETKMWGRGYATEALAAYAAALFATGNCEAMRMDSRRDNVAALRVCQKIGFEVEHVWANGQFQTMILTQPAFEYHRLKAEAG
jgi:RimJ/RimL family protein N-acetyltransferase